MALRKGKMENRAGVAENGDVIMKIKKIAIDPDPYEPFRLAQGYRVGDLLFISGQAAIDCTGQIVGIGDFDAQAEQVFENLERVLRAGGSSLKNVIKVTIFLRDMSNFDKVVKLRGRYFTAPYPADTIVEISSLYSPDALIEIEAVAIADEAAERT
jgi:2-iminobutanoate/2-iminopropanoate deaminase